MHMPVKATQSNLFYAQLLVFHDLGYVKLLSKKLESHPFLESPWRWIENRCLIDSILYQTHLNGSCAAEAVIGLLPLQWWTLSEEKHLRIVVKMIASQQFL